MHVLIIGVGRYTHLSGGAGPLNPDFRVLGQLNSPPVSARAMASWFLKPDPGYIPAAPLSTVELLLSDQLDQTYVRPDSGERQVIEPAIMANIERAFYEWDTRCSTNPGNIAFFYFCGHGLWKGGAVLLSENFAANRGNPWLTAIDFDATYTAMGQCRAQTQYFVIDACRQWTDRMRSDLNVHPSTLKTASLSGEWTLRTAPQLFGAAIGRPAFGDSESRNGDSADSTGQVSRLTQALLKCLRGGGSDKQGGEWIVNTDCLGLAVHKLIEAHNLKRPKDERQNVIAYIGEQGMGSRPLYKLPKWIVPKALVTLGCLPPRHNPRRIFTSSAEERKRRWNKGSGRPSWMPAYTTLAFRSKKQISEVRSCRRNSSGPRSGR